MAKVDDKALEDWLENSTFLEVPVDFEARVLKAIDKLPEVEAKPASPVLTWLALIGGGLVSMVQISAFILSVWQLNSAG